MVRNVLEDSFHTNTIPEFNRSVPQVIDNAFEGGRHDLVDVNVFSSMTANKNFRRLVGWKTTFLACFEEKLIWKMISERVCLGWDDCFSHLCSWQLGPNDGNSDNFLIIVMMVVMVIIRIMITHNFHGFDQN